jgi:predicted ester cyclase
MKKLFLFLFLSFLIINAVPLRADLTEQKKVITDRWLKLWNTGKLSIADEIFTKDFVSHIPQFKNVKDLASYKDEIKRTPTEIQNFHAKINDLIGEGDKIAARFSAAGVYIGKIGEKKIDHINYTNTWNIIFRFNGNKIAEEWWQFDILGVMQQVGIIPPSKEGLPALMRSKPEDFIWSNSSNITGAPGNPVTNKTLVMHEYKAWNQKNIDKLKKVLDKVYSPKFVYHDPARPHVTDSDSYKKWAVDECLVPFPDLYMGAEDVISEGDKVAVRWVFTGTHKEFGKKIKQDGISIYRIADGKIVEAWCACDMLGTVQQLQPAIKE